MSAKEGLYAIIGLGGANVALLTGVDLTWTQDAKRFYPCGNLEPTDILRGPISWEGRFRKAYVDNKFLGTFNIGTWNYLGTLYPRGGTNPLIEGTILLTGGSLANMNAESIDAVEEENTFIIYNMKFTD